MLCIYTIIMYSQSENWLTYQSLYPCWVYTYIRLYGHLITYRTTPWLWIPIKGCNPKVEYTKSAWVLSLELCTDIFFPDLPFVQFGDAFATCAHLIYRNETIWCPSTLLIMIHYPKGSSNHLFPRSSCCNSCFVRDPEASSIATRSGKSVGKRSCWSCKCWPNKTSCICFQILGF